MKFAVHRSHMASGRNLRRSFPAMRASVIVVLACFGFGEPLERRMFNGRKSRQGEFPYAASIRAAGVDCSGALISRWFVLTAAHCLRFLDDGDIIFVTLGTTDFYPFAEDPGAVKFRAEMKYFIHENFTLPSADNDIALIRLPERVMLSEKIQPIKMSRSGKVDQQSGEVQAAVMGWGEMETGASADFLQTARLKLIPISDCFGFQSDFIETITERHICARNLDNKGTVGPCDGDSGEYLHWIVSFSINIVRLQAHLWFWWRQTN